MACLFCVLNPQIVPSGVCQREPEAAWPTSMPLSFQYQAPTRSWVVASVGLTQHPKNWGLWS